MEKIIKFFRGNLDYPIFAKEFSKDKFNLDYYLDLASSFDIYPSFRIVCDDEGIARFDYSTVPAPNNTNGLQYSFTYICWYAIVCLQRYLNTKDEAEKQRFLTQAAWLKTHHTEKGDSVFWQVNFDWESYGVKLPNPRVSSMDQGLILSVLSRAYILTKDKSYLELAKRAAPFYNFSISTGGFKAKFKDDYVIYEMYPAYPLSKILDGFVFSLMGLYDLYLLTKDEQLKRSFDEGLRTIKDNLGYWDYHGLWSRFGYYYLSPALYHKINICWLKILYQITQDKKFKEMAQNWSSCFGNFSQSMHIKIASFIISRLFFIKVFWKKQIKKYLKKQILFYKISNLIKKAFQFIYLRAKVLVFAADLEKNNFAYKANIDFSLKEINFDNLQDLLSLDSQAGLFEYKSLLKRGQKGFAAYFGNNVIHRSWVIFGPVFAPILFNYLHWELKEQEALIYYCQTKEGFRGQGVYPAVLTQIIERLRQQDQIKKVYIASDKANRSSIQGILKAGFVEKEARKYLQIFGISSSRRDKKLTYDKGLKAPAKDGLNIKEIDETDGKTWNELIINSAQYNIFSSHFWLKTVSEATGRKYKIIVCYEKDRPLCGCAALIRKSLEGNMFTSAPLSQYSSILLFAPPEKSQSQNERSLKHKQFKSLLTLSEYLKTHFDWIILYQHPHFLGSALLNQDGWQTDNRYTYYLDLSNTERLYNNFDSALKRQIKKGQRSNFKIEQGLKQADLFYKFWQENLHRQKIKPLLTWEEFDYIYQKLRQNGLIKTFSAYDEEGNFASAVIFLIEKPLAYYWASTLNREYASSGINQFLLWRGLEHIAQEGIKKLDFVGADVPSIAAYKKRFGGDLISHQRISFVSSMRAKTVRQAKKAYKTVTFNKND